MTLLLFAILERTEPINANTKIKKKKEEKNSQAAGNHKHAKSCVIPKQETMKIKRIKLTLMMHE